MNTRLNTPRTLTAWCMLAVLVRPVCHAPLRADGFDDLVEGVSAIHAGDGIPGPLECDRAGAAPVAWLDEDGYVDRTWNPRFEVDAYDKLFCVALTSGRGRVVAMGHAHVIGQAIALDDNERFTENVAEWLDSSDLRRVVFRRTQWSHGVESAWRALLEPRGWTVEAVDRDAALTESALEETGVLVVDTRWDPFPDGELTRIRGFVDEGGGLLIAGLGWSWTSYHPARTLAEFPMNQLGRRFGVKFLGGMLTDPTDHHGRPNRPVFHRLLVPPGALGESVELAIDWPVERPGWPNGAVVDIAPDGTTFASPALLTLRFTTEDILAGHEPEDMRVLTWNGSLWELLPGEPSVDPEEMSITCRLDHLSRYGAVVPSDRDLDGPEAAAEVSPRRLQRRRSGGGSGHRRDLPPPVRLHRGRGAAVPGGLRRGR